MAMTDAIEHLGHWWIPGIGIEIPGILTFSDEDGGQLRLIGSFEAPAQGSEPSARLRMNSALSGYRIICGRSGNVDFTLLNSLSLSIQGDNWTSYAFENIHVGPILLNAHFDDDQIPFSRCSADLRYMTSWLSLSGINERHPAFTGEDPAGVYSAIEARWKTLPFVSLNTGVKVSVIHHLHSIGDGGFSSAGIRQAFTLRVDGSPTGSMRDYLDVVSDVQDLVSIGSGRTAEVDRVSFQHPEHAVRLLGGETSTILDDIELKQNWIVKDTKGENGRLWPHEMFFGFEDLGQMDGVKRWLDVVANLRLELARVMATRYSDQMFVSDKIANCAAALESFDRKRRADKVKDLAIRLRRTITLAGPQFGTLVPGSEQWIAEAVANRNDVDHHFERFADRETTRQSFMAQSLYWLFVFAVLRTAAAPEPLFDRIAANEDFKWLAKQLGRTTPPAPA